MLTNKTFKLIFLLVILIIVATISFFFLAPNPDTDVSNNKSESSIKIQTGKSIQERARKKEMHWAAVVDSLNKELAKKPKIKYRDVNKKINTVNNYTDRELDSLLSNYRFEPLDTSEERNR